jgi:hypothetical protein
MATSTTVNNQTELKRKASARKGQATRLRNEALGDPRRTASRVRDDVRRTFHRLEQRGERERKRAAS